MSTITRQTIVIQHRFHGPPESGHGGYTCGLLAREINGAAQVSHAETRSATARRARRRTGR